MRCGAIARSTGRQCGRGALEGQRYCRFHQAGKGQGSPGEAPGLERAFYSDTLEEESLGLEVAAALRGWTTRSPSSGC